MNLVCSDFSVSILGNPFTLISALHHRWIFGKTMCVIYGFFMTLLGKSICVCIIRIILISWKCLVYERFKPAILFMNWWVYICMCSVCQTLLRFDGSMRSHRRWLFISIFHKYNYHFFGFGIHLRKVEVCVHFWF